MTRRILPALGALAIGFALGLLYAWVIAPTQFVDTTPQTLRADFKDQFRTAIAAAYSATHNLDRARARLVLLGDPDPVQALTAQAQRMLAAGQPFEVAQQVAQLATDLGSGVASVGSPIAAAQTDTLGPPTPTTSSEALTTAPSVLPASPAAEITSTPASADTPTPRPSRTPIPTPGSPFRLVSQDQVCNPNLTDGLLQVSVLDGNGHAMPGVEITLSWSGGEENFFTGLKPEISNGYADYVMQSGISYALRVANTGTPVSGLIAPSCPVVGGQNYTGGLKLTFQQP